MKIIPRGVALVAIAAIAFWIWTILFPAPEKIIRRRLDDVAQNVSFQANENPIAIAMKSEKLATFFSTNVEVNLDIPERAQHSIVGRAEIIQAAAGAHMQVKTLDVKFLDPEIAVSPDKQSATVSLVVSAKSSGETDPIVQPMKFYFQKIGRDWLITRAETLRALT
ncbi:MAG TPA: hypothetical protein VN516_02705 [Candidatus Baltobacteraceae bacterium]|nr:hypothetical protein [Candidatus Baltobacteraceae bacterium]